MAVENMVYARPSANGEGNFFSQKWIDPAISHLAVVQIAHGMNEHSDRYDRFARFLAAEGYVVYANDHIGHGRSDFTHRGTFSLQESGFEFLLRDMHTLYQLAEEEHPGLPRVLFGHSMGSIAAGIYAVRFSDVDVLLLMGMPAPNPMASLGIQVAKLVSKARGRTARSGFLIRASEATMGKGAADPMVRHGWLTRDEDEVKKFIDDPLNGDAFSASAYGEMLAALRELGSRSWAKRIPEIPILITAGTGDSVGGYGKGPTFYYKNLCKAGHKRVTIKLYPDARHELLNELNRDEVQQDLLRFIRRTLHLRRTSV